MAVRARPVLVGLRPLGLGDFLTGLPALRALRAAFSHHRVVLAAPKALEPLALLAGAADEVVDALPLRPLQRSLHGADLAVDLHGKGPASHRVLLASRPRRLLAFAHEAVPESRGLPSWRPDEHEVARWCRLLSESGIPADPTALDLEPPPLAPPAHARGATVIHPGAASAARRWPVERFAAVARAERARGVCVVVTGAAGEEPLARAVAGAAGIGERCVFAGRTSLLELAALVAAAGRVVCGDTGVGHLATALRTPSVLLFGPTSPAQWGPPRERLEHRVLWTGSTGDPHGPEPDDGLLAIRVADVLGELAELDRLAAAA